MAFKFVSLLSELCETSIVIVILYVFHFVSVVDLCHVLVRFRPSA